MTDAYKELRKEAEHLWYKFRDCCDAPHDQRMQQLEQQLKDIREFVEMEKAPRFIEDHVKQAQRVLETLRGEESGLMRSTEAEMLHHEYETFRDHLRRLPNY